MILLKLIEEENKKEEIDNIQEMEVMKIWKTLMKRKIENRGKDADYLSHAKSLYEAANKTRDNKDQGMQKSYYPATEFYDEEKKDKDFLSIEGEIDEFYTLKRPHKKRHKKEI